MSDERKEQHPGDGGVRSLSRRSRRVRRMGRLKRKTAIGLFCKAEVCEHTNLIRVGLFKGIRYMILQ